MKNQFVSTVIFREALKISPSLKAFSVISYLVLLNLISLSTVGQSGKYKLEDLTNRTWRMQGLNDLIDDELYEVDYISLFLNNKYVGKQEFYLSDSIVTVFDSINVGKVKEGSYIVIRPLRDKRFPQQSLRISVFEIKKLSYDTLILRNIKHQYFLMYRSK